MEKLALNYPKLRRPAIFITLLHVVFMVILFYSGINTMWYSILFYVFSTYIISYMFKYNNNILNQKVVVRSAAVIMLMIVFLFFSVQFFSANILNFIFSGLFFIFYFYALVYTIRRGTKNEDKKTDFILLFLLFVTFIFTLFMNAYQQYSLVMESILNR